MIPPPYPSISHLVPGRDALDDRVLAPAAAADLLASEVVVEEKLDGANVSIWAEDTGGLRSASRGGPGARDRAGQLGALRAWVAAHHVRLHQVLAGWSAVYAEWMLLRHTVAYDDLPSYLVVLDLWSADRGFATVEERNLVCEGAGLVSPPELWRGIPGSVGALERMIGPSAWGSEIAEGVIVRRISAGEPRVAKLLREGFNRLGDDAWKAGRPRNRLAGGEASWR